MQSVWLGSGFLQLMIVAPPSPLMPAVHSESPQIKAQVISLMQKHLQIQI